MFNLFTIEKGVTFEDFKVSESFPNAAKNMVLTDKVMLSSMLVYYIILKPLEAKFGKNAIKILSFIRDSNLNKLVGGVSTAKNQSEHLDGIAVDITTNSKYYVEDLVKWLILDSNINYRTLIYYPNRNFFHVSINVPYKIQQHKTLVCEALKGQVATYIPMEKSKSKHLLEREVKK